MDVLRERVEQEAELILAPFFESLADLDAGYELRMRAAERLLDRTYGRPKQAATLTTREEQTTQTDFDREVRELVEKVRAHANGAQSAEA